MKKSIHKKRILVTGAAGFIGSHLSDSLVSEHELYGVDDLSGGSLNNVSPKSRFTKLDLTQTNQTARFVSRIKPDILFHLAADASEGRSQFTPIGSTQRNLFAYVNTLIPAIKSGVKKVILLSSMSVYGDQTPPFSEDLPTKPVDIYGVSKQAMEEATRILAGIYGFQYVILRPHNVYGPRQNMTDPYRNVVAIFINRLLARKPPLIYGDGRQKRAFTYIDDIIPFIIKAGLGKIDREIINLGPTQTISINELANLVLSHFVKDPLKAPKSLRPVHLSPRPLEVQDAFCTNAKAQKLLGLKENIYLKEGLTRTIAWARKYGHQPFRYLTNLELTSATTPKTWTKKLL